MFRLSIRLWKCVFAPRRRVGILGFGLVAVLAAACSFDASKLRAPQGQVRDAASVQPGSPDLAGAGDDSRAGWDDAGKEVRSAGQGDVSDLAISVDARGPVDVPFPDDLAGGSAGLDGSDEALGLGGMDGGGTGGTGGGTGGLATGGAGGMDGDVNGETDGGAGGVAGDATGGTGGGGMGGEGGTGGVATGGTSGGDPDAGVTDAPGTGGIGADGGGDEAGIPGVDPDLVVWYRFDESSGTTAYDSAKFGGVARDATLATRGRSGSAGFSTVKKVGTNALALSAAALTPSSGGGYVVIPALHTLAPEAITIAVWLNLSAATSNENWERVFDYADSSTNPNWFNLTARSSSSPYGPIFSMSNVGHATADQQRLVSSTALTANAWHHIAVVLSGDASYTGLMYIDGVVVATNTAMTLHLSDIGATANNWLGRSEFTSDPYFNGSMDDFRVYKRALSKDEIVALMAVP